MVKRGNEVDLEYSKKEIIKKMNIFFGYNVVDDIKLKTFEGEFEKIKENKINNATKSKNIKKIMYFYLILLYLFNAFICLLFLWVRGSTIEDLNKNLKKVVQESGFKLDFDKCIADSKIEDFILEDRINGAKNYKIEATPTLIINGEKFENTSNYKKLKKYIEKLI